MVEKFIARIEHIIIADITAIMIITLNGVLEIPFSIFTPAEKIR